MGFEERGVEEGGEDEDEDGEGEGMAECSRSAFDL